MKKPLIIIFCVALSIGVKAQGKHTDTLSLSMSHISMGWFSDEKPEYAIEMSLSKDSTITIYGDTLKAIRMLIKQQDKTNKLLNAAQFLLRFINVQEPVKNKKLYRIALREYWKLNNDKRYKTIKK